MVMQLLYIIRFVTAKKSNEHVLTHKNYNNTVLVHSRENRYMVHKCI